MAIKNVEVVNTASKYIVKSTGVKSETDQKMIKGGVEGLTEGNTDSTASLIECYYIIEGTGTLKISADAEHPNTLSLTGKGKYGLRPGQLKYGEDKQFKITTDANVKSYLLVTEFRRN
jgi:hypothetical protein